MHCLVPSFGTQKNWVHFPPMTETPCVPLSQPLSLLVPPFPPLRGGDYSTPTVGFVGKYINSWEALRHYGDSNELNTWGNDYTIKRSVRDLG